MYFEVRNRPFKHFTGQLCSQFPRNYLLMQWQNIFANSWMVVLCILHFLGKSDLMLFNRSYFTSIISLTHSLLQLHFVQKYFFESECKILMRKL